MTNAEIDHWCTIGGFVIAVGAVALAILRRFTNWRSSKYLALLDSIDKDKEALTGLFYDTVGNFAFSAIMYATYFVVMSQNSESVALNALLKFFGALALGWGIFGGLSAVADFNFCANAATARGELRQHFARRLTRNR